MTDAIRSILYATDLGEGSETVFEYAIGLQNNYAPSFTSWP